MKRYLILFILSLPILLSAQSPAKLVAKGEYDKAIEECVDKLSKGKGNKTDLYASLKEAYEKSNAQDMDKIMKLKSSQMPEIWYEVFTSYYAMQKRYFLILPLRGQLQEDRVNIHLTDYSEDEAAAKSNAVAFEYAYAQSLLKTGKQDDALQAYIELLKITKLVKDYKDVDMLMRQALGAGSKMALLEVKNSSDVTLSPDYMAKMENIALNYNERQFMNYKSQAENGESYPLRLVMEITSLVVTPGTVNEKEYTTSHKNPESLETAYTDQAKKESDKKNPEYNKCKIKEIYQIKTAVMKGTLKYIDGYSGTVLYVVPLKANSVFENKTATASGDLFACPPEVYEILNKPKKKFPKNADMMYDVGKEFKILVKDIVWNDAFIQ
jgi:tetratricopeptide (TPR) repeat protein